MMELLISAGVFSVILLVLVMLFSQSLSIWQRSSSRDTATRELRKVRASLERDLSLANPQQVGRAQVPDHLGGGGKDGEALWFLSPIDPATHQIVRAHDGTPVWQRNILYYLVVPQNHNATFGVTCAGGAAANGYDDRCPHKVLIRKIINQNTLLPNVNGYLTAPNGYDLSGMGGEPSLDEVKIVASHLLTFSSVTAPPPQNIPSLIAVDARAVAEEEARRKVGIGTLPMFTGQFTLQGPFTVMLRN